MTLSRAPRPTLASLTGIRFLAAFIVTLFHANTALRVFAPYRDIPFLRFGYVGVSLFFVLSGFILTYTYIQPDNTLRGDRPAFWRARFARVYPVYFLGLLVAAPLFLRRFFLPETAPEIHDLMVSTILSPVLLQSWWPPAACQWNCVGWSLSVETLFYALFPVLGVWIARRSLRWSLIISALIWSGSIAIAVAYVVFAPDGAGVITAASKGFWLLALKHNPVVHLGEFALGIGCGLMFLRRPTRNLPALRIAVIVSLVTVVVMLVPQLGVPYPLLHTGILAPAFGTLIYALACRDAAGVKTVLGSPVMFKLGESSYALYLLHATILGYFTIAGRHLHIGQLGAYGMLIAAIGLSIWMSILVFDYIEEPARKWIRRRYAEVPGPAHGGTALPKQIALES